MEESNHQLSQIQQLCCKDIDMQLINYVLKPQHMMLILNKNIWLGFNYINRISECNHEDYSTEQLHVHFLDQILPNISKYDLNEEQQHVLKLLNIHPNFKKVENGYKYVDIANKVRGKYDKVIPELHFTHKLTSPLTNKIDEFNFQTYKRKNNLECHSVAIVGDYNYPSVLQFPDKIISAESHILLSAMLSSEYELSQFKLLSLSDIRKRLSEAKCNFANKCILPQSVKISSEELIEVLKSTHILRFAIMDLYQKSNFGE